MTIMAFRPKMNDAMDEVVDLRPHTAQQADPARKPDMRVDFSTLGNSELASKLPSFLEEMARANRETQELMAADPKAARIEIDDDEEVDTQVIEMNLYSGVLESEEPKKEIVMPNGQPLAGNGAADGDSDAEPFISEPVKVRHTTNNNNNRKRRAPSSSSSKSSNSSSSSSSSEGETRIIKIPTILERKNAREGSLDTQASADSTESSGSFSREVSSPKKKKIATTKECSPSPPVQSQDVQSWVDDQPSVTGDYTEIPGAPRRKMLIPRTRVGAKESQKNVQDWVNNQADQQADE